MLKTWAQRAQPFIFTPRSQSGRVFICVPEANLHLFPQLMLGLPQVEACAVALQEGSRLLAFAVPSRNQEQSSHPGLATPREQQTGSDLGGLILNQLSLLLPSYSVPDALLLLPALPLTPHGE